MADYVLLHWDPDGEPPHRVGWVRRAIEAAAGWRLARDEPGRLLALSTPGDLAVRRLSSGAVLIGEAWPRDDVDLSQVEARPAGFEAQCRWLVETHWGAYVLVEAPHRGRAAMFRAPLGGLEAVVFEAGGVQALASSAPDWLLIGLAPVLALDWRAVQGQLVRPGAVAVTLGLHGAEALVPGTLRTASGAVVNLWSAAQAARRAPRKASLCDLARDCVARQVEGRRVLVELSGGFDSAVVAWALGRAGGAREGRLLNYHTDEPEGDERGFARLAARAAGLPLIERRKPDFTFDPRDLAQVASGWRPGIWGLDGAYDADVAGECGRLGADLLLTGKGGDTVFYQMPSPLIAADHLRRRGLAGLFDPTLPDLAAWTRRSVWSLLRAALMRRRERPARWMAQAADLPPGKALQVRGLIETLAFAGPSRRASVAAFHHPLLAQPIVEHCLARSSVELTQGRRDRAYARAAFAGRLPPQIAERYGKGDATAHFGRAVASRLDVLREYLLEGLLVEHRVLDRRRLEPMLTAEHLIWSGGAGQLLHAATIEAWTRAWSRRLRGLG